MAKNSNLHSARAAKNDEFYTRLQDIENELYHYWYGRPETFKDKVVLCNCDDPNHSNFWVYFHKRYKELGLAGLIAIHYSVSEQAYVKTYTGGDDYNLEAGVVTYLQGDGDFRSAECIEILKMSDIVVTNPPFSLFREYISQLMEYNKKFIIIGNLNAVTYKEVFPLIRDNKMWFGVTRHGTGSMWFEVSENMPDKTGQKEVDGVRLQTIGTSCWFTNIDIPRRHERLITGSFYEGNEEKYPKYDNYDAINVDKVMDIPEDYDGVMGVPITFLGKHNPEQFEIIGGFNGHTCNNEDGGYVNSENTEYTDKNGKTKIWNGPTINKKTVYYRICIKALPYIEEE